MKDWREGTELETFGGFGVREGRQQQSWQSMHPSRLLGHTRRPFQIGTWT